MKSPWNLFVQSCTNRVELYVLSQVFFCLEVICLRHSICTTIHLSTANLIKTRIWFWFLHAPVVCQALFALFKHWVVLLVYPPAKSLPSGYVLRKSLCYWETVEYNWNWSFSLLRVFGVTIDWWRSVSVEFRLLKLINNSQRKYRGN